VSTIDGTSPTNPAEEPGKSPQRVPRITIFVHHPPNEPVHRAIGRMEPSPKTAGQKRQKPWARRLEGSKHQLDDPTWLGLLERVLYSWPITVRLVVLLAVVLTGTAALAAIVGVGGQLLLAALSLRARRGRSRRLASWDSKAVPVEDDDS